MNAAGVQLTVVVPVYNEEQTVAATVDRLLHTTFPCPVEFVIVDDGSTDSTEDELAGVRDPRVRIARHSFNRGKGAAVLTGIDLANGSHLLVFDADLEYLPSDIPALLQPIVSGRADVVYGSRIQGNHTVYQSLRYALGNRATTWAANIMFDAFLKDLHTCLKLVPIDMLRSLRLRENGFGLDTEVTAKLLRAGIRPYEVPVSYRGRTHGQGKKLTWRDGVDCLRVLWSVRQRPAPVLATPSAQNAARETVGGISDGRDGGLESRNAQTHRNGSSPHETTSKVAAGRAPFTVTRNGHREDEAVATVAGADDRADAPADALARDIPMRRMPLELARG